MKFNNIYLEGLVEDYAMRDWINNCFQINNFYIPKELITSNKNKINLVGNRNKLIKQASSPFANKMKDYLDQNKINYVQEFIIIIKNRPFWEYIINSCRLSEKETKKYKKMNYFSLDFLLLDSLTCVEIDSNYHNNRTIIDQARDHYLKVNFGIETIRIFHFGEDSKTDNEGLLKIKQRESIVCKNPGWIFDYHRILIDNFIYEKEYLLIMLDRFVSLVNWNITSGQRFTITEKDLNYLADGINFGDGIRPITFGDDFIELAKGILNIEINICKNVVSFSIEDIYYILENKNITDILRRNILQRYNCIPYWVSEVMKIPIELQKFIRNKTGEDIFILKSIKKIYVSETAKFLIM